LLIGLVGSLLMFGGDMLIYYDKNDYDSKDKWNSIYAIVKKVAKWRLFAGGLLGPLTAFLYAASFYHIVLMTNNANVTWLAWAAFLISALGIIFGGAYHLETALLALLVRSGHDEAAKSIFGFINKQAIVMVVTAGIGLIIMFVLLVAGWTVFPQWVAAVCPLTLMLLLPLVRHLPKGRIHMIVCGGWSNLPFVIYYAVAFVLTFFLA
ncbi:MAG: hypothetical protein K6F32_05235, partial [Bacilli bacterium]|nr:hypothetical protein [Bacilli bacterium]